MLFAAEVINVQDEAHVRHFRWGVDVAKTGCVKGTEYFPVLCTMCHNMKIVHVVEMQPCSRSDDNTAAAAARGKAIQKAVSATAQLEHPRRARKNKHKQPTDSRTTV